MTNEIWKDIPDYEGLYQVSNLGRVRSCENKVTYSIRHGERHWKQRIMKISGDRRRGLRVRLWKDKKEKSFLVHRLVGMAFLGKSDLTINHINGNRFDNRLENLEWCSLKENILKGFETGLYPQTKIEVYFKETGETKVFRSLSQASQSCGYNHAYFSNIIKKKNRYENDKYKWRTI